MTREEIREGDIVEIDYIAEFTKEHTNEGKALVIWKGFNHQPLVRKLDTKNTDWTCYEHISKVVGHIDIEGYMDKALEQEPKPMVEIDLYSVIKQKYIEREVLDKIRAEIEQAIWEDVIDIDGTDEIRTPLLNPDKVFEIIGKYDKGDDK